MKFPFLLILLFLNIHLFSQPWTCQPYLDKPVDEASYFEIINAFDTWWGDRDYQRGNGFMPFKRWQYMNSFRYLPSGQRPDPAIYLNTYRAIVNEYEQNKHQFEKTDISNWTPLGITSWTNGTNGYNPGNGRVNAVAIDPKNPLIIFIAAPSGGVWKSTDGGQYWNTTFDQMPHLGVSAIAIHPDSSHIIFIGTGDRDASDTKASGIYKSIDGGNTWLPSGFNSINWISYNKIIFNPQNPNTMFVAANNGIFRSYDSGQNWTQVFSPSKVMNLMYHPADTNIIYGCGKFFIKSTDAGCSFVKDTNLPSDTCRIEIAVTPANPDYVYVLSTNNESSYGGTYRSTNSGGSFIKMSESPNYLGYSMDADDDSGQGWYDLAIAASPVNANEIFIGGINVWKSFNSGNTFSIMSHWVYDNPEFYTHADIHFLGFFGNRLYCGSDGGVFYSDDFGASWIDISEGLGISQVYRMASSPVDPDFIVCGTQDNGSNKLQNGNWIHVYGADGMQPMTHHSDTNTFYFSYQFGGLMKTTDNGVTVEHIIPYDASGDWITPFDMHPQNSDLIYAAYSEIYRTVDGGWSWTDLTGGQFGSQTFSNIRISPANPDYIYASKGSTMYISTDNGQTWTSKYCGSPGTIVGIEASYSDPEKLWLAVTGNNTDRVLYSDDAYQTFTNITGNLNGAGIRSIVHQKNSHDALFVGTENAVFFKDTTMANWIPYVNGLPNTIISDLEINYTNNMLRAATYGRGIWETPIPVTEGVEEMVLYNKLKVFPNPTDGNIFLDLSNIEQISAIQIFDITGKIIFNLHEINEQHFQLDLREKVSGIYFIKVVTDSHQYIERVVLYSGR